MHSKTFTSSLVTHRRTFFQALTLQYSQYYSMALVGTRSRTKWQTANRLKGNYTQCSSLDPLCVPAKDRKPIFSKIFQKGKRYLLRLINSSTESGFIFTIDNHLLEIINADFVPIYPFKNESIHIGIGEPLDLHTRLFSSLLGQRYSVIIEADPSAPNQADGNYWIRTIVSTGCGNITNYDNQSGIIRYDPESNALPISTQANINLTCADPPLESLVPVVPWSVDNHAVNNVPHDTFEAFIDNATTHGYQRWDLTDTPLWWVAALREEPKQ